MSAPEWQCVFILWGAKYGAGDVNHIVAAVRAQTRRPPRMVLLTDRPRPGLAEGVETRPIPEFYLRPAFMGPGCQTKIALFEPGVLADDLPAVFLDLDTVVLGDLSEAVSFLDRRDRIALLPASFMDFGLFSLLIWRLSGGRWHARGNSSMVVFHPAACHEIAERFRDLIDSENPSVSKALRADDQFLSWVAQRRLRRVPRWFAAKLSTEFMLRPLWLMRLRSRLPWVRRRWDRLRLIALPGDLLKPEILRSLPDRKVITDRRGRYLDWSDATLGVTRSRLVAHAESLEVSRAAVAAFLSRT